MVVLRKKFPISCNNHWNFLIFPKFANILNVQIFLKNFNQRLKKNNRLYFAYSELEFLKIPQNSEKMVKIKVSFEK